MTENKAKTTNEKEADNDQIPLEARVRRTIKFRAKSESSGEWIYGHYYNNMDYGVNQNIIVSNPNDEVSGTHYIVDSSTLCQFTGIKDSNGKEVYEGDIIETYERYETNKWEDSSKYHVVVWGGEQYPAFTLKPGYRTECNEFSYLVVNPDYNEVFEVSGNIFENPELLKKVEYA